MVFLSESPVQEVVISSTGKVVKPLKLVITAFGEANRRAREAGIYSDKDNSLLISKTIEKYLKKVKPENIKLSRVLWDRRFDRFIRNHSNSTLALICNTENADILLLGFLEEYIGGTAGQHDMYFYQYLCKSDDLVKESNQAYDRYPYQLDILKGLKSFFAPLRSI